MLADQAAREMALDVNGSFCVSAPAGSGKTELLTQRILALLLTVEEPDQVLAITFTRKARAEMLERIMGALSLGQGPEPEEDYKKATWRAAKQVLQRDSERDWQLLLNPKRLRIQTIDSFNQSVAAESPLLNGLGSTPRAVDNADALYLAIVPKLLGLMRENDAAGLALQNILLRFDGDIERFSGYLVTLLSKRDQWQSFLSVADDPELFAEQMHFSLSQWVAQDLSALQRILKPFEGEIFDLINFANGYLPEGQLHAHAERGLLPECSIDEIFHWQSLIKWLLTAKCEPRKKLTKKEGFPAKSYFKNDKEAQHEVEAQKQRFLALSQELGLETELPALAQTVLGMPNQISDSQLTIVGDLLVVLKYALAYLRLQFAEQTECDHLHIAQQSLDLLGAEDETTAAQIRWQQRVRHILIDEYQDTSLNQNQLLARMVGLWDEARELNPEQGRSLFVVGDGMQSIYRFRAAKVGLFIQAMTKGIGAEYLQHLQLQQNFRSKQGLVAWFNRVFQDAFPQQANVATGAVPYSLAIPSDQSEQGKAAVCGFESQEFEAAYIAQSAKRIIENNPVESIAVLVRSRAALKPIITALKANDVAYQGTDTEGLMEISAVLDVYYLAKWLLDPADNVVFCSVLKAPWCGASNTELLSLSRALDRDKSWFFQLDETNATSLSESTVEVIQQLRLAWVQRDRMSLADSVLGLWYSLRGDACALEDQHYVSQFIDLMREARDINDTDALNDLVGQAYAKPVPNNTAVQLMTIHKSKGLEFDHVFIPGLAGGMRPETPDLLEFGERLLENGDSSFLLGAFGRSEQDKNLRNYIKHLDKQAAKHEALRVLYVGATRAVQTLNLTWVYAEDSKTLEPKAPTANSLLGMIWPQVENDVTYPLVTLPTQQHVTRSLNGVLKLDRQALPSLQFPDEAKLPLTEPPESESRNEKAEFGIVVHSILETLAKVGIDKAQQAAIFQLACKAIDSQAEIDDKTTAKQQMASIVATIFSSDTARWLLKNHHGAVNEWSLVEYIDANTTNRYVIDRSFVDDGVRWIIDYKSSQPQENQTLASFLQQQSNRYLAQLKAYQSIVETWQGHDHSDVIKTALYFPAIDVLHEVAVV